jgi:hypothetical protein
MSTPNESIPAHHLVAISAAVVALLGDQAVIASVRPTTAQEIDHEDRLRFFPRPHASLARVMPPVRQAPPPPR